METLVSTQVSFEEAKSKDLDKWNIEKEVKNEVLKKEYTEAIDILTKEKAKEFSRIQNLDLKDFDIKIL